MGLNFKVFFLAVIAAASAPHLAWGSCGVVEVSKGDIRIQAGATKAVSKATMGSSICSGDTIIAGADSRAKLKMEDGNELNISPDSKIVLESYEYNKDANKKKVLLNVLKGKIRATTKQENMYNDKAKDGQANTFQVQTKSAVAGVRGTDFLTSYDVKTDKTEIVTFRGKVEVGQPGPNGSIMNSVSVSAGQTSQVSTGQTPTAPIVVPKKDLDKTNGDTKADAPLPAALKKDNDAKAPPPSAANDDKKSGRTPTSGNADADSRAPATSAGTGTSGKAPASAATTQTSTAPPPPPIVLTPSAPVTYPTTGLIPMQPAVGMPTVPVMPPNIPSGANIGNALVKISIHVK